MKKFLKKLLVSLFVLAIISFALPRTADGQEEIRAPHTEEEILLLRRQGAGKLQEECGEAPPEYAEKVALIERARALGRDLGVWSEDMYKCYDPAPRTILRIYSLKWGLPTAIVWSQQLGWLSAEFRPESGLYVNVQKKDFGGWVVSSLPDMNEEEMTELREQLVRDGYAWYGRMVITSTKKELQREFLMLPVNEIVENFLHESCHDFFTSRGMSEIRSRPDLEEPLCTVYGFRAGMMFLAAEDQAERQILEERYRWSLKRAVLFNRLWWQLAVVFDASRSEEERVTRQDQIFAALTPEDINLLSGVPPNTAFISSMGAYTLFFPAAVELWELLTGEPPIDMNPPPPEDVGEISPLPHRKTTTLSASHRQRLSFTHPFSALVL